MDLKVERHHYLLKLTKGVLTRDQRKHCHRFLRHHHSAHRYNLYRQDLFNQPLQGLSIHHHKGSQDRNLKHRVQLGHSLKDLDHSGQGLSTDHHSKDRTGHGRNLDHHNRGHLHDRSSHHHNRHHLCVPQPIHPRLSHLARHHSLGLLRIKCDPLHIRFDQNLGLNK